MTIERFHRRAAVIVAATLTALAGWTAPAAAQSSPLLADADWLAQHLTDRGLVLLHVGGDYAAGHIPGAVAISEDDLTRPHDRDNRADLMLELPAPDVARARLAALGVSDDSRIVVYAGRNAPLQQATRIVYTLDYLGLGDRTTLLNGGLMGWTRAGKAVTTDAPVVVKGGLSARATRNVVVDASFVQSVASRPNHKLVDARAAVFYKGLEPSNGQSGHIPGAISIPFSQLTNDQQLIDRDRVAALFRDAGVKPGDTIVAYCHIGQQATAVIFGARLLGYQAMLYDGSFQDWSVNHRGPVVK
jgi:thiosulfate/3-mercaptopyruvate sulfurtransferase